MAHPESAIGVCFIVYRMREDARDQLINNQKFGIITSFMFCAEQFVQVGVKT